jgi:hypothetical protein
VSEQSSIVILLYGPGGLGLLMLLGACIFGRRVRLLVWTCAISVFLHMVSFTFIYALVGIGSGGDSSAFEFPWKILLCGLVVTAALTLAKAAHFGCKWRS